MADEAEETMVRRIATVLLDWFGDDAYRIAVEQSRATENACSESLGRWRRLAELLDR